MGVPYSWGGGKPNGPSTGVDSGASTVGFDCSGLTRFIVRRRRSADPEVLRRPVQRRPQVPPSQAKRGDLIFYGPGGGQHVTMYLGGGQMLEASWLRGKVTVSPVRTPGMQPYLARIIES